MIRRRRSAFSLIEILITIVTIAIIAGLTLSALRRGRETAENLKIAQVVRGGVSRCAELKVQRLPNNFFHVRWKGDQNEPRPPSCGRTATVSSVSMSAHRLPSPELP